jgi:hypothetical protein
MAHLDVGNSTRVQVYLHETLEDLPEDATILQALDLVGEKEFVEENIANVAGKLRDVVEKIGMQVARVLTFRLLKVKALRL